jgi:hypothetical protein
MRWTTGHDRGRTRKWGRDADGSGDTRGVVVVVVGGGGCRSRPALWWQRLRELPRLAGLVMRWRALPLPWRCPAVVGAAAATATATAVAAVAALPLPLPLSRLRLRLRLCCRDTAGLPARACAGLSPPQPCPLGVEMAGAASAPPPWRCLV